MPVIHITDDNFRSLPIFPLQGLTLFPGMIIPLHIFEPKYVALLEHCLENQHLIALANTSANTQEHTRILDPEHDAPPVFRIMGAGIIIAARELPKQRWNILVQGVVRVEALRELIVDEPFRLVEARVLLDADIEVEQLKEQTQRLKQLLYILCDHEELSEVVNNILASGPTPEELTHAVAAQLIVDPVQRQRVLELLSPLQRAEVLNELVGQQILERTINDDELPN